jgi:perosamine synthetase
MISYGKQSIDQEDIDAVLDALQSDWLTQGPHVEKFENNLNNYFGSKYSCALSNGTAALHLSGLACGWQENDIIITSPITFLASVNSILYSGATPEFVDIDNTSYTIDPNLVEEKVKMQRLRGKNVKAIIAVDFAGHPCDWNALKYIADKYELKLINDNCHAMGAKYKNKKNYAIMYADIVTQSYHAVKHITTGEGGAVLTNNNEIYSKIKTLRTHGMVRDFSDNDKTVEPWFYEMRELGYNYRITDFQCALGSSQLKKLDNFVTKRNMIAQKYNNEFSNFDCLSIPLVNKDVFHSYHLYALQINFKKLAITKPNFFNKMKNLGINLQVHYIPVHLQPYYKNNFGFSKGDYPISENFYSNEVSLPIYPDLSDEDQQKVINNLKEVLKLND